MSTKHPLRLRSFRLAVEAIHLAISESGLPRCEIDRRLCNLLDFEELPPSVSDEEAAEVNATLRRTFALAEIAFPECGIQLVRWPNRNVAPGVFIVGGYTRPFRPYNSRKDCAAGYPQIIAAGKWEAFEETLLRTAAENGIGNQPTPGAVLLSLPPTAIFCAILKTLNIE